MNIRQIVLALEEVEEKLNKQNTSKECEMISELIDKIIADDLDIENKAFKIDESKILDTIVKIGIDTGQIGQA